MPHFRNKVSPTSCEVWPGMVKTNQTTGSWAGPGEQGTGWRARLPSRGLTLDEVRRLTETLITRSSYHARSRAVNQSKNNAYKAELWQKHQQSPTCKHNIQVSWDLWELMLPKPWGVGCWAGRTRWSSLTDTWLTTAFHVFFRPCHFHLLPAKHFEFRFGSTMSCWLHLLAVTSWEQVLRTEETNLWSTTLSRLPLLNSM